jgi:uncharacterized membrane protein HdeD (DUF308 family)
MKHNVLNHSYGWQALLAICVPGVLVGLLLLLLDVGLLLKIVFAVLGIVAIVYSIPGILSGARAFEYPIGKWQFFSSLLMAILGLLMLFVHNTLLTILFGVLLLVAPLVRIIMAKDHMESFKSELPKLILGLVLVLVGPAKLVSWLLRIAGCVILALTLAFVVACIIDMQRKKKKIEETTGNRVFVDTTGDGKIDTVYTDVDGDGKPDVSRTYREK